MDYKIECKPPKSSRYTIGYLDENSNDEYHGYITEGLFEAARKYGFNAIRFGHFASNVTYKHEFQINMVLEFIEQFELDGLIFLGWARAVSLNNESFKKRFRHIPLLSLGAGFEQIPHVYSAGDQYIHEILLHLIKAHHYRKIAFIAPFWPDNRSNIYINTMEEYGYYQPELYISERELANLEVPQRGKKAVSILLDERKLQLDAIVSLFNAETEGIILELQARGFNVPKDIAVTSYEDGALGKFNSPSFTTVYYPWKELGYYAGEKMAHLLTKGVIPFSTVVPGRIIIRDSCGCKADSFYLADTSPNDPVKKAVAAVNGIDWEEIYRQLTMEINGEALAIDDLLTSFRSDFEKRSEICFLKSLEARLRLKFDYQTLAEMKDLILIMRRVIFPYIQDDEESLLLVEDLFQQAQVLLREKLFSFWGQKELTAKKINLVLQKIGHAIISNYQEISLLNVLEDSLPQLDIPSGYVFIFKNENRDESNFNKCFLAFQYNNGQRINPIAKPMSAKKLLIRTLFPQAQPSALMANMLHVADEFIGFVLFEPGPTDERVYQTLSIHISTALQGTILIDKLDNSYQKLVEQAHHQGKADTATSTLHNIGNVLNNINTSTHLISELSGASCINDYINVSRLFEENLTGIDDFIINNRQGQKGLEFYLRLCDPLAELRNKLSMHIDRIDERIKFIEDIIIAYQNYTGTKSLLEEVELTSILEDALKIHQALFEKHHVIIVKYYLSSPKAFVHRTKLFHVLVNLIKNAVEALLEISETNRKLTINIYENGNSKFIHITDTGCGISPDKLKAVFTYGYSTKINGHGFGLHSCANYMSEMKANIWAESEGSGKGATFVLKFN